MSWLFGGACSGWAERQDPEIFPLGGTVACGNPDPDPHLPPWAPHRAAGPCLHLRPCGASPLPHNGSLGSTEPGAACAVRALRVVWGSESSAARPAALAPCTPQTSPQASDGAAREARQGGDLGQGQGPLTPATVLAQRFGSARAQCPAPTVPLGMPWGTGHCGHHLPRGPSQAEHRAGHPHCLAGLGPWAGSSLLSACSAPGLGCKAWAGSAPRRRLTGPPGSPGSAGGTDSCGKAGMAEPPTALPALAVGKG